MGPPKRGFSTGWGVCLEWLQIKAGIPIILPATQEQFIPQMANLDAIGGISFQKGCYPGQEIVARTQYLEKSSAGCTSPVNIELATSESPVKAGDELFGADMREQSIGMVVNATASPDGGFDVLAVIQASSVEGGKVHWKTLDACAGDYAATLFSKPLSLPNGLLISC